MNAVARRNDVSHPAAVQRQTHAGGWPGAAQPRRRYSLDATACLEVVQDVSAKRWSSLLVVCHLRNEYFDGGKMLSTWQNSMSRRGKSGALLFTSVLLIEHASLFLRTVSRFIAVCPTVRLPQSGLGYLPRPSWPGDGWALVLYPSAGPRAATGVTLLLTQPKPEPEANQVGIRAYVGPGVLGVRGVFQ